MKKIDLQLFDHPDYGVERMTDYLKLDLGYQVNKKRIRRLYKLMRVQTIYPKLQSETKPVTFIPIYSKD